MTSSLVGHVVELLDDILRFRQPADAVAASFLRSRHYLGSNDRRFINETTFAILRNFRVLQAYVEVALVSLGVGPDQRARSSLLFYAAHALKGMLQGPDALLPSIAGLWRVHFPEVKCEAFLQALDSASLPEERDPRRRIALQFSFPESIVREWSERFGEEETSRLCAALNQPAPITVRVNTLKTTPDRCREALMREGVESVLTSLSPVGLRLAKRINAQALAAFREGLFEMQDEGSQVVSLLLEAKPGQTVVDACAGGGGKTLHLAAMMENAGFLYAIEVESKRLNNIRQRLSRAGVTIAKTLLVSRDSEDIRRLTHGADAVLVDAPCSGVGTFRRNPGAKLAFTAQGLENLARRQRDALRAYAPLVKSGGRLVYSTCSLLKAENEDIIEWFLGEFPGFRLTPSNEVLRRQGVAMESSSPYLSLLPHRTTTDGFFSAVMEKLA